MLSYDLFVFTCLFTHYSEINMFKPNRNHADLPGGVNLHDENVFGVIIETFGTLNFNISDRSYRRKQCTDEQE